MADKFDFHICETKANFRLRINLTLLAVCFTAFTFMAANKPSLLKENFLLATQITLAIPFLITSSFARTKEIKPKLSKLWNKIGYINFIIGYSFLINTIGIMLAVLVSVWVSIIFFITNILMSVIYSYIEFRHGGDSLSSRLLKDGFFILMLIILGIIPSLGML